MIFSKFTKINMHALYKYYGAVVAKFCAPVVHIYFVLLHFKWNIWNTKLSACPHGEELNSGSVCLFFKYKFATACSVLLLSQNVLTQIVNRQCGTYQNLVTIFRLLHPPEVAIKFSDLTKSIATQSGVTPDTFSIN